MDEIIRNKINGFFSKYPKRHVNEHEILVFANDDPPYIFYLESGSVGQYDVTSKGQQLMVNIFMPPAFFPMSWAINRTPNDYLYESLTDSVVRLAPPADVVAFLKREPDVMFDLLSRVYRGTDGLLKRTALLMEGNTVSRLLFELNVSCLRFGKTTDQKTYILKVKESELAARTGLARETVSRHLKQLKNQGAIDTSVGTIVIADIKALQQLIQTEALR